MSIRLMTLVWDVTFPTQSQKLLMLKMADYASDAGGSVFPATETLADKVGCDERTIQRAVKAFTSIGLLHLVRQGGGSPGSTNEWRIDINLLGWLATETVTLSGAAGELKIVGRVPNETPGNLPLGKKRPPANCTEPPANCTPTPGTTAGGLVTNHHIDSSRASARASEGARAPARRALPQFTLTPADSCWGHWITWLTDKDRRDLVMAAQEARQMTTLSRWPTANSSMPQVDRSGAIEKRKTGDAA